MFPWILLAFLLAGLFLILDWLTQTLRGDCNLSLQPDRIRNTIFKKGADELQLRFELPLENRSTREQALLLYVYAQPVPASQEDKNTDIWIRVSDADSPRQDGYFAAVTIKPEKSLFLQFSLLVRGEESVVSMLQKKELPLHISYSYYGRKPMRTESRQFSVLLSRFAENPAAFSKPQEQERKSTMAENARVLPIRTPIIFPGTNLSRLILQYAEPHLSPGDWVILAESAVAIAQGRVYPASGLKPGFFAKRLNRFFHFNSSLASCYSMELAIRETGLLRILLGIAVGTLGKFFGRRGDFYRIAGRKIASIDDCTGTLPPFDKSVVMGPENPDQAAEEIKRDIGYEVAIVDANDLQRVDILGKSSGIGDSEVMEALRENPQGNADEQTPIVILKK